ncbi:hypothetical protein JCM13304A_14370 [Desulfothermus okinawensis JCM 13304]
MTYMVNKDNKKDDTDEIDIHVHPIELIPNKIVSTEPKDAPLDTPKIKGEARGVFKIDWKTIPQIASPPPAMTHKITLGILMVNNMVASTLSMLSRAVLGSMCWLPMRIPDIIANIKKIESKKILPLIIV